MQQHGGAHTHSGATHGGQQGFGEGGNALQKMKHGGVGAGGWLVQKIRHIIARTEHRLMALNDQHPLAAVLGRLGNALGQGRIHGRGERVFFLHPVDCQCGDACVHMGQYLIHAQSFLLSAVSMSGARSQIWVR